MSSYVALRSLCSVANWLEYLGHMGHMLLVAAKIPRIVLLMIVWLIDVRGSRLWDSWNVLPTVHIRYYCSCAL